ncbi:MAG: hypothetical protein KA140_08330 [Caldisericia bacterium]|nr:hypothetical protein [Caldisericia bacterium]
MKCQSCGRQSQGKHCTQCTDENGNLKTFEEIVQNLTEYFIETQGFDREVARSAAIGVMSRQPAWEQKMKRDERGKDMRMKTFLIVTAAVFTVVGAGIAYWMGTKTKADDSIKFRNFSKPPQAPFENIEKSKVDMFDVYEMKCPADQKLVELDGDYLTIKSLEGSEFSPDYQLYTYNTAAKTEYKFVPESLATRTQHVDKGAGLVFQESFNGNGPKKINWYYCAKTGEMDTLNYSIIKKYGKMVLNVSDNSIKAIDTQTGTIKAEVPSVDMFYSAVSDNFVVYFDLLINRIVIKWFNGKKIELPNYGTFWDIDANNAFVLLTRIVNEKEITTCHEASTGKAIWEKNLIEPVFISKADNSDKTIICWSSSRPGIKKLNNKNNDFASINFICMNNPEVVNTVTIPSGYDDKDMYPIGLSSNLIAWDCYRHNYRSCTDNAWNAGTVSSWDVWVYDIANDTNLQLDSKNCDTVLVDGWKVAWEKYENDKEDQYYNIKYMDLFVDDREKKNVSNSDLLKSTEVISKEEPFEITEIKMDGEQSTSIIQSMSYINIVGDNNDLLPFVSGQDSMIYNINTKQKIKLRYNDDKLPIFLKKCLC